MWASDCPLLTFDRCAEEIEQLPFRDDAPRQNFGHDNAVRTCFE